MPDVRGPIRNLSPLPDIEFQYQPNGSPWASLISAHNGTPLEYRADGKVRFIDLGDGKGKIEYWYKGGTEIHHLVPRYENLETAQAFLNELNAIKTAAEEASVLSAKFGVGTQTAVPTSEPEENVQVYTISQTGTYSNFGGIVVTTNDLQSGLVQLRLVDGEWIKYIQEIELEAFALSEVVEPIIHQVDDGGSFTIGASDSTYTGVPSVKGVRANKEVFKYDGDLDKIELWGVLAGDIKVKLYRIINGLITQYWDQVLTIALGQNIFLAGTHYIKPIVYKGGRIGVYSNNTGTASQTGKVGFVLQEPGGYLLTENNNVNGDIVTLNNPTTGIYAIKATYSFLSINERIRKLDSTTAEKVDPTKLKDALPLVNKFDASTAIQNRALSSSAVNVSQPGYAISARIDISGLALGDPIALSDARITNLAFFFDANDVYIANSRIGGTPIGSTPGPITLTKTSGNQHYLRFNINMTQSPLAGYMALFAATIPDIYIPYEAAPTNIKYTLPWLYQPKNPVDIISNKRLKGRRGMVCGNSITQGVGTEKTYWQYIAEWAGMASVYNDGKSGTGLVKPFNGNPGIVNRTGTWPAANTIDFISFMGNMNDGTSGFTVSGGPTYPSTGLPLGTFADATVYPDASKKNASVYGALHWLFQYTQATYPLVPIMFIISTPRLQTGVAQGKTWGVDGWFEQWTVAIKTVCAHYSIPCLDLYHESNFKPWVAANNTAYFDSADGIHPNAAGHEMMAQKIIKFWEQYV